MLTKESLARIKRIEINTRKQVGSFFAGGYASVFRGQGMTFSEVRVYQPGDDIRRIDWNVSARMPEPYIKQFVEERELTLAIVVDVSRSMVFGSRGMEKIKLAAELAALFAFLAIKNNDRVSLIAYSDRIEKIVPPKKGKKHVLRLANDILTIQPQGQGSDVQTALSTLRKLHKRHAVVIWISDFIGLEESVEWKSLSAKHDVIPIALSDQMESHLPNVGFLTIEDSETGKIEFVDTSSSLVRATFTQRARMEEQRLREVFRKSNMLPLFIETGKDYSHDWLSYFKLREKL